MRAADLENDVWHLWLERGKSNSAQAVVGRAGSRDAVQLGGMRFIVDTGCGYNLIAERYVRGAGAMGSIRKLFRGITLNTAGVKVGLLVQLASLAHVSGTVNLLR